MIQQRISDDSEDSFNRYLSNFQRLLSLESSGWFNPSFYNSLNHFRSINHFSRGCFVSPEYFFGSLRDSWVWSRQPIPPSQCPVLSTPFSSCLWQETQSLLIGCSKEQYPHSIVIPLTFSCSHVDATMWQSSQLKHLPQHPYLNHLKLNFTCLQVPLPGSSVSGLICTPLRFGLNIFIPPKKVVSVSKQWWQFTEILSPGRYNRPLEIYELHLHPNLNPIPPISSIFPLLMPNLAINYPFPCKTLLYTPSEILVWHFLHSNFTPWVRDPERDRSNR